MNISEILRIDTFLDYCLLSILIFISSLLVLKLFEFIVTKKLRKIANKTKTKFDDLLIDIIEDIGWPFYVSVALYFALKPIEMPEFLDKLVYYAVFVIVVFYVIRGIQRLIDFFTKKIVKNKEKNESMINLLSRILKGMLWVFAVLLVLSNLGYNITSLIAGLGIGGVAVALALQNILEDIFSSFSIYFDKPFKIGDFIIVGDDMGVVKKIGIKTTRLESLWGQEIVISNKELTSSRVNNYKKMARRRIHFTFGVTYQTPTKKLKKIPDIVDNIFKNTKLVDLDRVHFKEFGDFSLNFEIAYYVNSSEYNDYMNVQQEINFAIKEQLEKEKIEFAYPTQTIFVNK